MARGLRYYFGFGSRPDEEDPPVERDDQYRMVVNSTVISSSRHNIDVTVTAGSEHPTLALGTPVEGVDIAITAFQGTLSSSSGPVTSIVDQTRTSATPHPGRTPTHAWDFDPQVGGTVRFEAPDGEVADYSVTPGTAPAYTLTASAPSTAQTNGTIQVTVTVTDDNNGDALAQGIAVAPASGSPSSGTLTAVGGGITNASGQVTFNWTMGASATTATATFETPATGDQSNEVSVTVSAPTPVGNVTMTEITTGGGTVNTSVSRVLEFRAVSDNSLVNGLSVNIASGYPTPSGSATGGTTGANGRVTILWTMGGTAGTYNLRVSTPATGQTFDLTPATATQPTAGSSPHYRHIRMAAVDYRLNVQGRARHGPGGPYLTVAEWNAELDFYAARYDCAINGYLPGLLARNPTFKVWQYVHTYAARLDQSAGLLNAQEAWATQNGYDWEDFFLHHRTGQTVGGNWTDGNGNFYLDPATLQPWDHYTDHQGNRVDMWTSDGSKTRLNRLTWPQFGATDQTINGVKYKNVGGAPFWYYNMGNPGYQAWRTFHTQQTLPAGSAGYFCDSNSKHGALGKWAARIPTLEYANITEYMVDHITVLEQMQALMPSGIMLPNQSTYVNKVDERPISIACRGTHTEFVNASHRKPYWEELRILINQGVTVMYGGQANDKFWQAQNGENAGNYTDIIERRQLWNYASCLMLVDPNNMDLVLFENYIESWTTPYTDRTVWIDAFAYDIGLATSNQALLTGGTGTDGAGQNYKIWRRNFENAVVLIRRDGDGNKNTTSGFGDPSAVTVDIASQVGGGPYRLLRENGPGATVGSTIQIRGGEALILISN